MKRLRLSSFFLLLLGVVLMAKGWTIFGLVCFLISASKIKDYYFNPNRKLIDKIRSDSSRFGVAIPENIEIQNGILALYRRVEGFKAGSPQLETELERLKNSFWMRISTAADDEDWLHTLGLINRNWPVTATPSGDLVDCLDDLQKTAGYLNDIRSREVRL